MHQSLNAQRQQFIDKKIIICMINNIFIMDNSKAIYEFIIISLFACRIILIQPYFEIYKLFCAQMQKDKNSENQEEENQYLKFKLLPLFATNINVQLLPLHTIQIVTQVISYLQILKFSVDYRTTAWLGYQLPIFSYLDLSYYVNLMSFQSNKVILVISIIYMTFFCFIQILIFILGVSYSNLVAHIRKILLFVTKNILFMSFLNIILKQLGCPQISTFKTCFSNSNTILMVISICTFVFFMLFVAVQSFLNFSFLADKKRYVRLKKSSYNSVLFMIYVTINQLNYLLLEDSAQKAVADISTIALLVFLIIKEEQLNQQIRLLQIAFVAVNLLALLILDIQLIFGKSLGIPLFFFLSVFVFASIMQSKTWSLRFQLENINKWITPDIMIRYSNNLNYFLTKNDQYIFLVFIYGYMQIHRQKCDSLDCPTRCLLSDTKKSLSTNQIEREDEQLLRANKLIKQIFHCGYLLTPVSPDLQLQNSTFLYENNQKQLALKDLLMIKYEKLSLDKYYRYYTLKEKVKKQINQEPNKKFLDLVSEMEIKREQQEIIKKFENAAMINLQFWSCLNEDHPDFLKMNEVASARIQIHEEVKRSYQLISSIAHSEKITVIFVNYLDCIQNDELVFNQIYAKVKKQYSLDQRIVLQDWNNTSHQIMMVSIDDSSYGKILDLNSSCGTLLGYQKFQLVNQHIKLLFIDALKDFIKEFLTPINEEKTFYLTHKSGYLLKVSAKAQYYNSMSTGMTAIISINVNLFPYSGFFLIDRRQKIVGISASILPLIGLDSKAFEGEVGASNFFLFDIKTVIDWAELKQQYFSLRQLIKPDFHVEQIEKESKRFKFHCIQNEAYTVFELNTLHLHDKPKQKADINQQRSKFQFQVQATANSFKYFGSYEDELSHISQFSEIDYKHEQNQLLKKIDYSQEISTLRLYQNKIQIIEQIDENIYGLEKNQRQSNSEIEEIYKKDEQEIFRSKQSYQDFIQDYKMGYFLYLLLGCSVAGLIAMYIAYFFVFSADNYSIQAMTSQVAYQNLIIGSIAKQMSFMSSLDLISINKYPDNATRFISIYKDNINYLEQIQLMGQPSFPIVLDLQNINQTFMTNQFLLTFIDYANTVIGNASSPSLPALAANLKMVDPYIITYLTENSATTKEVMISHAISFLNEVASTITTYQTNQAILFSFGILYVIIFTVIMIVAIHTINKQRISIFQIFLDLSDHQIQQYSSKTEKFLFSLHVEQNQGQLDIEDDRKKTNTNSSSFAKRKRFKSISFSKGLYIKLSLISLFFLAFFIQSFAQSKSNQSFQLHSYNYFFLISKADYEFFTGLTVIQQHLMNNKSIPTNVSDSFRGYYQQFITAHYDTFEEIQFYHEYFMNVLFDDICHGVNSSYGSTQIAESCQLPLLYPNGSFLVFIDTLVKTEEFDNSTFTYSYLVAFEVLSKVHRKITKMLVTTQESIISNVYTNLLNCLLIWILISTIITVVYALVIVKRFIEQINEIKYILTILPISVARQLPLAKQYLNKMIKSRSIC